MPEILTDAYLLFTFVFKQALRIKSYGKRVCNANRTDY